MEYKNNESKTITKEECLRKQIIKLKDDIHYLSNAQYRISNIEYPIINKHIDELEAGRFIERREQTAVFVKLLLISVMDMHVELLTELYGYLPSYDEIPAELRC